LFVIPNEVRNLSGFGSHKKEAFFACRSGFGMARLCVFSANRSARFLLGYPAHACVEQILIADSLMKIKRKQAEACSTFSYPETG
jgi:hypothetical protein